jgi:hypothetical protein
VIILLQLVESRIADSESSSLGTSIHSSIEHICLELRLDQNVKSRSIELLHALEQSSGYGSNKVPAKVREPLANAVACALVSIAHEEAWRKNRVPKHLPDKTIGGLYGLTSSSVVYNKRLVGAEIEKAKIINQKESSHRVSTLR